MSTHEQLTTFYVDGSLFGIEVMKVQEVTGTPTIFPVPRAPQHITGIINLRGQIATAVDLRILLASECAKVTEAMTVICRSKAGLVSFVVDSIGDVVEVKKESFETTPDLIPASIRQYIRGIYKMDTELMCVLDTDKIFEELSPEAKIA